jgi:hypothetical protein
VFLHSLICLYVRRYLRIVNSWWSLWVNCSGWLVLRNILRTVILLFSSSEWVGSGGVVECFWGRPAIFYIFEVERPWNPVRGILWPHFTTIPTHFVLITVNY